MRLNAACASSPRCCFRDAEEDLINDTRIIEGIRRFIARIDAEMEQTYETPRRGVRRRRRSPPRVLPRTPPKPLSTYARGFPDGAVHADTVHDAKMKKEEAKRQTWKQNEKAFDG